MIKRWSVWHYVCWLTLVSVLMVVFVVLGFIRLKKLNNNRFLKVKLESDDNRFSKHFVLRKYPKYFTLTDESGKVFAVSGIKKFLTDEKGFLMTSKKDYVMFDHNKNFVTNGEGSKMFILI
jgi:hypothetical protein